MANVKFSELALNSATSVAVRTQVANGVKVYRALLSQSGTNAPVATILENSLGSVPVWTRDATGYYFLTLAGAFPVGKCWGNAAQTKASVAVGDVTINRIDANFFVIAVTDNTGAGTDDGLDANVGDGIEIIVYP